MLRRTLHGAVLGLLLSPSAAVALGLGEIRLNSALNAPLDAEIELISASAEELSSLRAEVASAETFARYGLERPGYLGGVTFSTARSGGRDVIRLRTHEPVTEPFVTLLVELNWARGRLVREFTVLLDPPVYTPGASPPAQVAAAVSGAGPRAGTIERAAAEPAREAPRPPAPAAPTASAAAGDSYAVRRGDTLSAIAAQLGGDQRLVVGLYRANPAAFDGDMNQLRSGSILRIPGAEELAAITPTEARAEIRRQYTAWRTRAAASGSSAEGRLRLVTPSEGAGSSDGAAAQQATAEVQQLRARVAQLEGELSESRRLLELRGGELAALQARLAEAQSAAAAAAAAAAPAPAAEAAGAQSAEGEFEVETPLAEAAASAAQAPAEPPPSPEVSEPAEAQPPADARSRPVAESAAGEAESGGFLDLLARFWFVVPLMLAALGGGGLFAYRKYRQRQQLTFDDHLGELAAETTESSEPVFADTARIRPQIQPQEQSFVVEEVSAAPAERAHLPEAGRPAAAQPRGQSISIDETMSSETSINLDQVDPLAEADFHMAYGLYDQAADLVRIALERDPTRRDLRLKLLEVFFVWGNREQFLQTARELAATRAEAPAGEWEKVVIMGKQLAPEDPLFAQSVSGAAAGGVDLDLEGGQDRVDFDVFETPGGAQAAALAGEALRGGTLDPEFGDRFEELADSDPTGEAPAVQDADIDFVIDEADDRADGSGNTTRSMTAQMPAEPTVEAISELAAEAGESPTVEQPAPHGGDISTIQRKLEIGRARPGAPDQTTELSIDDLGLDVPELEQEQHAAGAETATLVAGLDEHTQRILQAAHEEETSREAVAAQAGADAASGTWLIGEGDFDAQVELTGSADATETASFRSPAARDGTVTLPAAADPSSLDALHDGGIDLDLGGLEELPAGTANGAELDLDVGTPILAGEDPSLDATQRVSPADLALPDLEPVTMSEVGTKLDLARAYMDMGDPEGARSILDEVLNEGSMSQKQEAQRLIASLPG